MVLSDLMGPRSHGRSCDVIGARPKAENQTFCFNAPPKEICSESVRPPLTYHLGTPGMLRESCAGAYENFRKKLLLRSLSNSGKASEQQPLHCHVLYLYFP